MNRAELTAVVEAARQHDPTGQWGYGSRVSVRHRYVYLSVPKAACSTVKVALHRFEGLDASPDRWGEVHDGSFGLSLLDQPTDVAVDVLTSTDSLRFAFVRNPYDRLLSAWKSKLAWDNAEYEPARSVIREAFEYPTVDGRRVGTVSFRDSVEAMLDPATASVFDAHWDRQVDLLMPDVIDLDIIGRFERFAEDFVAILDRLNAPGDVRAMATTVTNASAHIPLAAAYDTELARRVHDHYLADFATYGYDEHSWRTD